MFATLSGFLLWRHQVRVNEDGTLMSGRSAHRQDSANPSTTK